MDAYIWNVEVTNKLEQIEEIGSNWCSLPICEMCGPGPKLARLRLVCLGLEFEHARNIYTMKWDYRIIFWVK